MRRQLIILGALAFALAGCDRIAKLLGDEPTREQQARSLLARGKAALDAGDLDVAVQLLEQASAASATDPEPQLALGQIYARLGNDGQAILALKRVAELAPQDIEARGLLADLYLRHGNAETAAEHLRKAVEATRGEPQPELMRRLATALLRSGNTDEAEAVVQRLDRSRPGDPETLALFGEILIARGDEERAVRLLDAAVAGNADSARVRTARARYFYSRGKVNEALREFELAVKAAPDDMDLAMARARALAAARRFDEAAELMDQVVAARPTDVNAQAALAEIKLMAGDPAAAREVAEAVVVRQPRNGRALYVRARAIENESQDDPVRAINAYRDVIDADGAQVEALSRLWQLYARHGDTADAMSTLEHLMLIGEATADEEVELAAMYGRTGINVARGQKIVAAALKRDPGNDRYLSIKRALDAKAREAPRRAPPGGAPGGIEVIKGRGR